MNGKPECSACHGTGIITVEQPGPDGERIECDLPCTACAEAAEPTARCVFPVFPVPPGVATFSGEDVRRAEEG